jgi:hypothetical protein
VFNRFAYNDKKVVGVFVRFFVRRFNDKKQNPADYSLDVPF